MNKTISWDEYFMGIAVLSSRRSKDPANQVGACIAGTDKKMIGTGYNGTPRGWDDEKFPWGKEGEYLDKKFPYVIHAELNAILNSGADLKGCTMYATLFPCNECAKAIVQAGIKEVVYLSDEDAHKDNNKAAKRIFSEVGVSYRQFALELN